MLRANIRANKVGENDESQVLFNGLQVLSIKEQIEEYMFLGLRLTAGINSGDFQKTFHEDIGTYYAPLLKKLAEQNLIQITANENEENSPTISLTPAAFDIANYVLAKFLLD
jgi:oxygen-independent coproporphyrinogen-3 oxidase